MRSKFNYAIAYGGALAGCLLTLKYLNQDNIGLLNWLVIGIMFVGAIMAYRKAEQQRE